MYFKGSNRSQDVFFKQVNTIDDLEELEAYKDRFNRGKVMDGKFISCSPFRDDKNPSFVLFLDRGNWLDSGTDRRGSFVELLSFLSGEDEEGVKDYLLNKYNQITDVDLLQLKLNLNLEKAMPFIYQDGLPSEFKFRHPYLNSRGISEAVQRGFKIGYDKETKSVVIPWTNKDGQIVRLQFRSVNSKKFWFSKEGDRIKNHLFGLYHIYRKNSTTAWIVEAPIDCMYLWTQGIPSIATGTASISNIQLKLLKQSPIETLIIASDNDEAGMKMKDKLIKSLGGVMILKEFHYPDGKKDVNEISPEQLINARVDSIDLIKLEKNL